MKDYTRNNTLYKRLLDAAGDDKLPVLDNRTFESMNAEYGKEEMRKNLADYIATERPVFPLKEITAAAVAVAVSWRGVGGVGVGGERER